MLHTAGLTVAMMEVLVRPPRESCKIRVSLLSLCGNTQSHNVRCYNLITDR